MEEKNNSSAHEKVTLLHPLVELQKYCLGYSISEEAISVIIHYTGGHYKDY